MNRLRCWVRGHVWFLMVVANYKSEIDIRCIRCHATITAGMGVFNPLRHDLSGTKWDSGEPPEEQMP